MYSKCLLRKLTFLSRHAKIGCIYVLYKPIGHEAGKIFQFSTIIQMSYMVVKLKIIHIYSQSCGQNKGGIILLFVSFFIYHFYLYISFLQFSVSECDLMILLFLDKSLPTDYAVSSLNTLCYVTKFTCFKFYWVISIHRLGCKNSS